MSCVVPGCRSRAGFSENVSFHRFPTDSYLKKLWVKNIRKDDNWSPSKNTRICSLHFDANSFREGYERRALHSKAVPTIFPNQPLLCKPKLPKKRKLVKCHGNNALKPSTSTSANTDEEQADSDNSGSESVQPPPNKAKSHDDTLSSNHAQQSSQWSQNIIETGHHQDQLNTRHTINVMVNYNKKERQKRYREQNREKLKQREAERRKRKQHSQSIAGPSTSSNTNTLEVHNEDINNEEKRLTGSSSSSNTNILEANNEEVITALQKKREYQRRYREQNRDKLKQREAERRRRLQNAEMITELFTSSNIEPTEIIIEPIITVDEISDYEYETDSESVAGLGEMQHVVVEVSQQNGRGQSSANVTEISTKLQNNMENYMTFKKTGSVKKIQMKPECLPLKFECQSEEPASDLKKENTKIATQTMSDKHDNPKKISTIIPKDCDMTAVTIKTEPDLEDVYNTAESPNHNVDYTNGLNVGLEIKKLEPMDADDDERISPDLNTVKLEVEEHPVPDNLNTKECPVFEPCTRQMLPRINMFAILQYFIQNSEYQPLNFNKLKDGNDDVYGDDTVGHVHIHKLEHSLTLQCAVAFDRSKSYTCIVKYDMYNKNIEYTNCECQNAACEHIIAFLMWCHRRSEERIDNDMSFNLEPMTQETSFVRAKDLALDNDTDSGSETLECGDTVQSSTDIVQEFLIKCVQKKQFNSPLYKYMCNEEVIDLSLHRLACDFVKEGASHGAQAELFVSYCSRRMEGRAAALARLAAELDCALSQEMHYARIDGEHFLMAAEGNHDIIDQIMYPDMHEEDSTVEEIRTILEKKLSMKIERSGIFMSKEHPILCATPYGITNSHVIDITYVKEGQKLEHFLADGVLTKQVKAKLQLYMYLTKKTNSILYLGYIDDNDKKQIQIHEYPFNSNFCDSLLEGATDFWKKNVYMKVVL